MEGKVIKYGRKNIDTDLIIPARYLNKSDPEHLAAHVFQDLDKDFEEKKDKLDATILVGGSNFGSGSSREHAPIAIKAAGINCVIAPSFARIFFRNAINIGLPIIEFDQVEELNNGDRIKVDFHQGKLANFTTDKTFSIRKMPQFLQEIIAKDGLARFAREKILNQ
ncbi:MAG: 3-isopropylmalate dehydratase small subunit [Promethearchaeia archaeon]